MLSVAKITANNSGEFSSFISSARRSRFILIVDEIGYNSHLITCREYPRMVVWALLAIGNPNRFPDVSNFVCPSGKVLFIEQFPLPEEQMVALNRAVQSAGVQCNF